MNTSPDVVEDVFLNWNERSFAQTTPIPITLDDSFRQVQGQVLTDNQHDSLEIFYADALSILSLKTSTTRTAVMEHTKDMIRSAQFPARWKQEGIEEPSERSIDHAFSIAEKIYDDFCKIPLRINPSIEEGVILFYWISNKNRSLKIETYNTNETVGLINENRTIVQSITIQNDNDLKQLCDNFFHF